MVAWTWKLNAPGPQVKRRGWDGNWAEPVTAQPNPHPKWCWFLSPAGKLSAIANRYCGAMRKSIGVSKLTRTIRTGRNNSCLGTPSSINVTDSKQVSFADKISRSTPHVRLRKLRNRVGGAQYSEWCFLCKAQPDVLHNPFPSPFGDKAADLSDLPPHHKSKRNSSFHYMIPEVSLHSEALNEALFHDYATRPGQLKLQFRIR